MNKFLPLVFFAFIITLCAAGSGVNTGAQPDFTMPGYEQLREIHELELIPLVQTHLHRDPDIYLYEEFEGESFPPTGWSVINTYPNAGSNWHRAGDASNHYAEVYYTDEGLCNEWLISPSLSLSANEDLFLSFWFASRYYWMCIYDGADMEVKVSTNGGFSWTSIWLENDFGFFEDETWYSVVLPLSEYAGTNLNIAFNYNGEAGDWIVVDQIGVFSADSHELIMLDPQPENGGTVVPEPGTHSCIENSSVNLSATPGLGFTFNQWQGTGVVNPNDARTSIVMDQSHTVGAQFAAYDTELLQHQYGNGASHWASVNADTYAYEVADDFTLPNIQNIDTVVVHGFAINYDYFSGWTNWYPANSERFIVKFYAEAADSEPDWANPVHTEVVWGKVYFQELVWDVYYLWKVELNLATPLTMTSGWVSTQIDVVNGAGGSFSHLLADAGDGNNLCFQRTSTQTTTIVGDINLELWGTTSPLDSPTLSICKSGEGITLSWLPVAGAAAYKIYSSSAPNPITWGDPVAMVPASQTSYLASGADACGFFIVIACP